MAILQAIDELPRRAFGPTGLLVTPICVGCAPLGSMPTTFGYAVEETGALATIRAAFASPINFLDTAAAYGDGESERRIGTVLRELGGLPQGFVLSTKADPDPQTGEYSGPAMRRSVERSLKLLGLERLQILYLHDMEKTTFENAMSRGGPVEVLLKLKEEGIADHIGVAGGPIDLEIRHVETGLFEAVITHNRYNLLTREAEPLIDLASRKGMAVVSAAPYGSGMLAKGPDVNRRFHYGEAAPEMVDRARRMQAACARYDVPLAAAALQFSLRNPRITTTIVGMSRPERIAQTLALAQHPIPDDLWEELAPLSSGVAKVVKPLW